MTNTSCRVAIWNIAWKRLKSRAGAKLRARIDDQSADLVCITEGTEDFLPRDGHIVSSNPDYGYPVMPGRRKVLLWSNEPWDDVDPIGHASLPPGRFISARTHTAIGPVRVIGVCIPWSGAHVSTGRRDRRRWEDHRAYIEGLHRVLLERTANIPTIMVGDFNQTVPRTRAPKAAHRALMEALEGSLEIATSGIIPEVERQAIDHLAHSGDLVAHAIRGLSNLDANGRQLSDHFGVAVDLRRAGS